MGLTLFPYSQQHGANCAQPLVIEVIKDSFEQGRIIPMTILSP